MQGAQGGLLMILAAVVLFVLWTRGYLAKWIGNVTDALGGATTAKPITNPLSTAASLGAGAFTKTPTAASLGAGAF